MPTKILAIDDSKTMRLAIKITFAAEDADVTSVSKGSEAVARAKQMGADVVLVDANLAAGEPSGYEVCRALKSDPATAGIPVIILVSNQVGVDEAQLSAVGGDDWLAKPFDTQELIDKVAAVRTKAVARPAAAAASAAAAEEPEAAQSGTSKRVRPQNRTQMGMPSPAAPVAKPAAAAPAPAAPAPAPAAAKPAPAAVGKPSISPASLAAKPAAATPAAPPPTTKPAAAAPAAATAPAAPAPAAARPAAAAAAPAPAAPAAARPAVAAAKPASAAATGLARPAGLAPGAPIPIAIPIPFTPADSPTPGMVERLRQAAAVGSVDPRVAEAIASLSREVIEAIVWEVVPELAESIIRQQARSA